MLVKHTPLCPPVPPRGVPARWTGERFHLGRNKEVFDAGLYAIMQAMGVFLKRNGPGKSYTIFSDSTAAIDRVCTDQPGPASEGNYTARGRSNRKKVHNHHAMDPSTQGVEGSEIADTYAKWAGLPGGDRQSPAHRLRPGTGPGQRGGGLSLSDSEPRKQCVSSMDPRPPGSGRKRAGRCLG